ncbi:acyl-CoA thioesterase [Bdellovibrio sp. HCB288]|uniref:acyl-CoA thioesterase n=1 Tax=Bdellovibrio sp. HCB288 TaxID=3394355 RepID=UPI0039B50319
MNLIFRLIYTMLISRFRSKVGALDECKTPYRCWPTDCDVLGHINNGVYFSMQDLARIDYMIRMGAAPKFSANGWYPVVVAERMRFKKSIKPFQKFQISTRLVHWDDKYTYIEHKFLVKGEPVAWGMIRARFLKKSGGLVSTEELLGVLGIPLQKPEMPAHLKAWAEAEDRHIEAVLPAKS